MTKAIKMLYAASNIILGGAVAAFAADLSVCYTLIFAVGWDYQDPAHTGLPWIVPILILTGAFIGLLKGFDMVRERADELAERAASTSGLQARNWRRRA